MACRNVLLATKWRRCYRIRGSSVTLVGRCHFSCYTQQAKKVDVIYPNALAETSGGGFYTCRLHAMTNNHRHFQTLSLILVFFSFACKTCTVMRPYVAEQYCWTAVSVGFCVSRHKNVMTVLSLCRYFLPSFVY